MMSFFQVQGIQVNLHSGSPDSCFLEKRVQKSYSKQSYPYSSLSTAMNPADIKAAAAEKAWHKDKKQKRKKCKDATEDNCSAATSEEGAPHEK